MSSANPNNLTDAAIPWFRRKTGRFLQGSLRVDSSGDSPHFRGGPSLHPNCQCPECGRNYSLVWDLDLTDPQLSPLCASQFAPATRLPLYVCWTCVGAVYRLKADSTIETFAFTSEFENLEADESPFHDLVDVSPREPLVLRSVPSTVEALLTAWGRDFDIFDVEAIALLERFYASMGMETQSDRPESFSSFGVHLRPTQGHLLKVCPNPDCPASQIESPYLMWHNSFMMKELALVGRDGNHFLAAQYFHLQYFVCCLCSTIAVEHSCG